MGGLVSYGSNVNLPRSLAYNVLQFGVPYVLGVQILFARMQRGESSGLAFAVLTVVTVLLGVWILGPALSLALGGEAFWQPDNDVYLAFAVMVPLGFLSAVLWHWYAGHMAAQRLHKSQVDAAKSQQLAQAQRLLATQARVEPQFLFDTLQRIQSMIDGSPAGLAKSENLLSDLIALLRAMQPHADARMSTLAREKEIIERFACVEGSASWRRLDWVVDDAALAAELAPQFLLPLLRDWLSLTAHSASSLRAALDEFGKLDVQLVCDAPQPQFAQALQSKLPAWTAPLSAVHGAAATLAANAAGLHLQISPHLTPTTP
jgi:hypothetical protein